MTPKEVKQDLRAISKKSQSIATMLQAIDRHRKCSDILFEWKNGEPVDHAERY